MRLTMDMSNIKEDLVCCEFDVIEGVVCSILQACGQIPRDVHGEGGAPNQH